jgi:hypothetical protein
MGSVYVCTDEPAPATPATCVGWQVAAHEPSPFYLSVEDASLLSGSILLVWAVGWVFRELARFLRSFQ